MNRPKTPLPLTDEPAAEAWNPAAALCCVVCGATQPMGAAFAGCPRCAGSGAPAPLEVVYENQQLPHGDIREILAWLAAERQPMAAERRVSLGRAVTPLVPVPAFGRSVYVKNETLNPTWSHKDRLHEVAAGAAVLLGARGILASSTGNHGAAAAAYAAAAGLPAVIFCHPDASAAALQMIAAYGGLIAQFDSAEQKQALVSLVDDGWFPATSMDPVVSGRSNPYGAEGYKAIAYEVAAELGRLPDAIIVPTASGDTVYGVAKGFNEVAEATGLPATRIVAAQPQTANPLQRSMDNHTPVRVTDARSFALSVADPLTGQQAMAALRRWNGETVAVSEDAIREAMRSFASSGLLVEAASAVSLAGYQQLCAEERIADGASVVLLATCAGVKWPRQLAEVFPTRPLPDRAHLRDALTHLTSH